MKKPALEYFPLDKPRGSQVAVINEIDRLFSDGHRVVILEAPVGSGKSAIAMSLALQQADNASKIPAGEGLPPPQPVHILTPRKSLQDQYADDFKDSVILMRGRNSYPCLHSAEPRKIGFVLRQVREGRVSPPTWDEPNCSTAPCRNSRATYNSCTSDKDCPYTLAIQLAQEHPIIVHNFHSFLYQTNFSDKFARRSLMVVDEAHTIEGIVREFATKKLYVKHGISQAEAEKPRSIAQWVTFLSDPKLGPEIAPTDAARKARDPDFVSDRELYLASVESLGSSGSAYEKGFSVEWSPKYSLANPSVMEGCTLEFVPHYIGGEANRLIFEHCDKLLLMSGTIYDKALFCRQLGLNAETTKFVRIGSTFPVENRPIYIKDKYQVNTSHAEWRDNFPELISIIKNVMGIFHDAKGLIHAPSYKAMQEIATALNDPRIVTHDPGNFLSRLEAFFQSDGNQVFISPTCQEGVDFKEDRARFQLILRVPNPSTGSKFMQDMVEKNFPWYNYQALVTLGQQTGRVNRSEGDYGATFLVDSRFNKFLARNKKSLPKWFNDSLIFR